MSLLQLSDLRREIELPDGSDLTILDGIDLEVSDGETIAIVGRSGSGKSTLLNIVGLLDSPSSGSYLLNDVDTATLKQRERSVLRGETFGFVFQQFNLLAGLSATENVAAPLLYSRGRQFWQRTKLAREMLDRVGLGARVNSLPTQLSGGEQQRVAIARALIREPKVILADEPTGALDEETGENVMRLLESLVADDGSTLITITHDLEVAARADRQVRMEHGRLADVETTRELAEVAL